MEYRSKAKIASGFLWAYGEKVAAQGIALIVTAVLARLIDPENYGMISIVTVFIEFGDIFVTGGFGSALVQKREIDDLDLDTTFVLSFIMGWIIYILLFLGAPVIAKFFGMRELNKIVRIMGLRLPLAAINTVQHASIQRNMEFKKFFFSTLSGTIISAVVGVGMALKGYGVWALTCQYLTNTLIDTLVLLAIGEWRPKIQLSIIRLKHILSYGWKILAQRFVYTFTNNIQSLVIGKQFTSKELAFYNNGIKIPVAILSNVYDTMAKVFFPAFSREQSQKDNLKAMMRQAIKMASFLLAPISIGLFAVAKPLIFVLLTEKWSDSIPFLQIYCLRYIPRPFTTMVQQAILAQGRSDIILKIEIVLNICMLGSLYIAAFLMQSVILIALGTLAAVFVGVGIYIYLAKKLFDYTIYEQIKDVFFSYLCAIIMGILIYLESYFIRSGVILLIIQIISGGMIYIGLTFVFNREQIRELLQMRNGIR